MLKPELVKKIEDYVYSKPRSVQEISQHISKNWRTADRYVTDIEKNFGTISTRVFREGTRGALKIAYWASVDKISSTVFQQQLEEEILRAKRKEDFSAFDIFQHVNPKNKRAILEKAIDENTENIEELAELLNSAQKQVMIFSGNLSFINLNFKKISLMKILDALVKRNVSVKIVCRVDIAGKENIEKVLSLNFKHGKELIEIRHKEHPIRAFIIDNKCFRIKEIKEPTGKINELDKKIFIFYTIKDKEWTEWISRIFWKIFSSSVDAAKRLQDMKLVSIK